MKATHLSAAALLTGLAAVLASGSARAEAPSAACSFSSSAPSPVVAAQACSLHATLAVDGRARQVDVLLDGRRCSSSPAPDGAIPVSVRITQHESQQRVVIEASPSDVPVDVTSSIVTALGRELRSRIDLVTAPPAPPPPQPVTTFASAPARASNPLWDQPTVKMYSPKMVGWGVALIVVGGLAMFGGTVGGFTSSGSGYSANSGAVSGLAWVLAGGAIAGIGIPLVIVGNHKVPVVSASVSPTGGGLRVAF